MVMCVIIAMKWVENYGDSTATALHSFGAAMTAIKSGQSSVYSGIQQDLAYSLNLFTEEVLFLCLSICVSVFF